MCRHIYIMICIYIYILGIQWYLEPPTARLTATTLVFHIFWTPQNGPMIIVWRVFPSNPRGWVFFLTGDRPLFRDVKDRQGAARKPDITKNEVGWCGKKICTVGFSHALLFQGVGFSDINLNPDVQISTTIWITAGLGSVGVTWCSILSQRCTHKLLSNSHQSHLDDLFVTSSSLR